MIHLENGKFRSQDFFIPSTYKVGGNNKTYDHYLITRKGCDMVANKLTGDVTNIRKRMALEGLPKSKIDKVSKLDAIAEDARLTEIYLAIVKEMAILYKVDGVA